MPKYTRATHWRKRHEAIGKKGEYETGLLYGDEIGDSEHTLQQLRSVKETYDEQTAKPSSPISVASTFDFNPSPTEVKPFVLPGAWVVVGKKGRALKNEKMYEEPHQALGKKKKKRKARSRPRKARAEAEPLHVSLDGAPSKCLSALERATFARQKRLARAQATKHWASYQRAKQSKRDALAELLAAMTVTEEGAAEATTVAEEGAAEEDAPVLTAARHAQSKDHKANRPKDKARRRARSAAMGARCFVHDEDEPWHEPWHAPEATVDEQAAAPSKPSTKGELELLFLDPSGKPLAEVSPPGAWTTVGKRGKALSHFPPLHKAAADKASNKAGAADKASNKAGAGDKASTEASKAADKKGKPSKPSTLTKCSLM